MGSHIFSVFFFFFFFFFWGGGWGMGGGVIQFFILTVVKRTRMFVLQVKSKVLFMIYIRYIHKYKVTKFGSRKLHVCPKNTKMGSIIGHIIDYAGIGTLRGQRHIPSKIDPSSPRAVFICIYSHYRINKQRDTSSRFEFTSILSTVVLSKHLITAGIIRKFAQLVNLVTM